MTSHFATSLARGLARSRKRRIGQHGLSKEAREGRLDVWLCQCGHRSDELRPGHAAGACRAALEVTLNDWLEIQPGKRA